MFFQDGRKHASQKTSGRPALAPGIGSLVFVMALAPIAGEAAKHRFGMTIEDTEITSVGNRIFHTFAFNGQVPGPFIHALKLKLKGE